MNRVLVTGSEGFIGGRTVNSLLKNNHLVLGIDKNKTNRKHQTNFLFENYDLLDFQKLKKSFEKFKPDTVFHFAAFTSALEGENQKTAYFRNNVILTMEIMKYCKEFKVENFVFSSSAAVYGSPKTQIVNEEAELNPLNYYGKTKLFAEKIIKSSAYSQINRVVLRYSNVYGSINKSEHQSNTYGVIDLFIKKIKEKSLPIIINSDGKQTRDFIHVDDVIKINNLAGNLKTNETFNVSSCKKTSINELVELMEKKLGKKIEIRYQPDIVEKTKAICLDNSKAREKLGLVGMINLEDGIGMELNQNL